jgi:signal transduction histidine kinase
MTGFERAAARGIQRTPKAVFMTDDAKRPPGSLAGQSPPVDDAGNHPALGDLVERVQVLCAKFGLKHRIECLLDLSRDHLRADPVVADVLVATVQELLDNVGHHANASRVEVLSAFRDDGSTVLCVRDDGIGFDLASPGMSPPESCRSGLMLADSRLREIGAYLEIGNESGACVTVVLPGRQIVVA